MRGCRLLWRLCGASGATMCVVSVSSFILVIYTISYRQLAVQPGRNVDKAWYDDNVDLAQLVHSKQVGNIDSDQTRTVNSVRTSLQSAGRDGSYIKLTDVIRARKQYGSSEQVCVCTHASISYIPHIVALAGRWDGPISMAIYSSQLVNMVHILHHLHRCHRDVGDKVSFHLYYNGTSALLQSLALSDVEQAVEEGQRRWSCAADIHHLVHDTRPELEQYPINVGRNLARRMSSSHYILVMDIEFLPSGNVSGNFLRMLQGERSRRLAAVLPPATPKVYVLPGFETVDGVERPADKATLVELIHRSLAVPFHEKICSECHKILYYKEWLEAGVNSHDLNIFCINKWLPPFWEPVYIGTNSDPLYNEAFTGYGGNKIEQVLELCKADYDFYILDNAFLVHTGIKTKRNNTQWKKKNEQGHANRKLLKKFEIDLDKKYRDVPTYSCRFDHRADVVGFFPKQIIDMYKSKPLVTNNP